MGALWRYWGYILAAIVVTMWVSPAVGPGVLIALSAAATGYFLLWAPTWCGAVVRGGGLCRNNASGVLLGCHLRQHKWQKLKLAFVPAGWRRLNRGLWSDPKTGLATIGALLGIVSTVAALVTMLVVSPATG